MRILIKSLAAILALLAAWGGWRLYSELSYKSIALTSTTVKAPAEQIKRGEYLAVVGNCGACHTAPGEKPFAGGKAIETPFGAVFSTNLTSDTQYGIGGWTSDAFYRAMREGVSANGRLLTPAFPFPNYTIVSREDSDALFAYFSNSVASVNQANKPHQLRSPYNSQIALAAWRVMFFKPATSAAPATDARARGEYLAQGLAHCSACHAERNALGAARSHSVLGGALMPMQDWYAPSLHSSAEAGVQQWSQDRIVALLQSGVTDNASGLQASNASGLQASNASVAGPMAEVVAKSTQYWKKSDLEDLAAYLKSLPERPGSPGRASPVTEDEYKERMSDGAALYEKHCATCHGVNGEGVTVQDANESIKLPALAGNRAVTMADTNNLVRILQYGGFAPSTAANPRPYGMPPFHSLSRPEMASVITYVRNSWGNKATPMGASELAVTLDRAK
jgi:mono/diheme cytochrome c family protein